jgi:hypothetical protein
MICRALNNNFLKGPAGEIEVEVENFILLNPAAKDLPFVPSDTRNLV